MKKTLITLVFLATSLLAEMNWTSYDKAFEQAKKENKTVMLMLSKTTCGVCKYMKTQVFIEPKIIEAFNKRFIGAIIEIDETEAPEGLEYIGTPTFYFLDSNKKIISQFSGGKNAKSFSKALGSIH